MCLPIIVITLEHSVGGHQKQGMRQKIWASAHRELWGKGPREVKRSKRSESGEELVLLAFLSSDVGGIDSLSVQNETNLKETVMEIVLVRAI